MNFIYNNNREELAAENEKVVTNSNVSKKNNIPKHSLTCNRLDDTSFGIHPAGCRYAGTWCFTDYHIFYG